MKVLVSFLGGDQDRPVVVGCLYNAQNPLPQVLPSLAARSGIRSRSTPGGGGSSEIMFDDRTGSEQLFIHAQRNFDEEVGQSHATTIGADRREVVERDKVSTVRGSRTDETIGTHARTTVHESYSLNVSKGMIRGDQVPGDLPDRHEVVDHPTIPTKRASPGSTGCAP